MIKRQLGIDFDVKAELEYIPCYKPLYDFALFKTVQFKNKRIYWSDQFDFHLDQILERGQFLKLWIFGGYNMQLAIELPDDLGKELLQQVSVNEFVQAAIRKMLLEQQQLNLEKKIDEAKKGHLPLTQSFIGVLAGTKLDESEYKKHLEDKYL